MEFGGQRIYKLMQVLGLWMRREFARNQPLRLTILRMNLIEKGLGRNSDQSISKLIQLIIKASTMRLKRLCEIGISASVFLAVLDPNVVGISLEGWWKLEACHSFPKKERSGILLPTSSNS